MVAAQNKTKRPSSIYEENPVDPRVGIPSNTYMFESIVRDTFNIDDSSSDSDDEKKDMLTPQEWLAICLEAFEKKNPIKAGRVAGPSQRKLNKLDCVDQAKIMIKKNQIKVAKREDGFMLDQVDVNGNLLDFMFRKATGDDAYQKMFRRTIRKIK